MYARVLNPSDPAERQCSVGSIICEEVSIGRTRLFHKGHRIVEGDLDRLATVERPIHAVVLELDDVHENEAARILAKMLAGPGIEISDPKLSRVNLLSNRKGLLRIDGERLTAVNRLPGLAAFSLVDRIAVLPQTTLAGAKTIPVAVTRSLLDQVAVIAGTEPILQVKEFRPFRVGVISTEILEGKVLERFQRTVRQKVEWFGGSVLGFVETEDESGAISRAILDFLAIGAELILTGGGNSMDPLDAALSALPMVDAELVKLGAPVHPGSMFWLAYRGDIPIFNLASCSMYSRATSADLVLPWIMAGERVTIDDLASLGFGGLLEGKSMAFRFPPYDFEQTGME